MGHAHPLTRCAHGDAALPVEPVSARLRGAIGPALAPVELGDQHEEAMIRGVDVAGERADLGREVVDGTHGNILVSWRCVQYTSCNGRVRGHFV
jgi:hypothetical protein